MNNTIQQNIVTELKRLYSSDKNAKIIFDQFSKRQKDARSSYAEKISESFEIPYPEVIKTFRKLDKIGCGRFLQGRKGHKTRIEWDHSIRSLASAAMGQNKSVATIDTSELEDEQETQTRENNGTLVSHRFQLRSDLAIDFSLPTDLSARDAERIAAFIRTLPFE